MAGLSRRIRTCLTVIASLAAALWLGWHSVNSNLMRSCTLREWPQLAMCDDPSNAPVAEQVRVLRRQIEANPGDSVAYTALASLSQWPGALDGLDRQAVLRAASLLAPQNIFVFRLRTNHALQHQQWPEAVNLLVRLTLEHNDEPARQALAVLVGRAREDAALQMALTAELKADGRWFEPVLRSMPGAKVPVVLAMPMVNQALPMGWVTPGLGQFLIRELKAAGYWVDAQALWIRLWNRPVSLLFNGEFEQGFVSDGFDWEVMATPPSRAGAEIRQPVLNGHGRVLEVEFTGRAIALPVVRQHLLLPAGDYSFSGEFMAEKLRSTEGVAWTFTCLATGHELGRTMALKDTGGQWQTMRVELKVPQDCGMAVALQLRTFAAYEAQAGLRGQIQFDRLNLRFR